MPARGSPFSTQSDQFQIPWSANSMTSYLAHCKNAAQSRWRGWNEQDLVRLGQSLSSPAAYSGGILKLSEREYRAWPEYNRRVIAATPGAVWHPVLAWVEGRGLRPLRRAG
jgi:hypothetical protein